MTEQDKKEFRTIIKGYQKDTEALVAKLNKESKASTDALIAKLNKESEKEIKRYIGGIQEQYNWNMAAILENTKGQQVANEKIDMMFENMGKQEIDIEVLKESARDHEARLQKIER